MIHSFQALIASIKGEKPKRLAIVNPKQKYLFELINDAEKMGWIEPVIYQNDSPEEAAKSAVIDTANGENDFLMKGDIKTATLLKIVLDKSLGLNIDQTLTHIAVVESPKYHKLMLFTDGGIHPILYPEIIHSMIENGLTLCTSFGNLHPNIALLSLVEKVTDKIPETILADETVRHFSQDKRMNIEGPIALDVALSKMASKAKGINSSIAGETDLFVGPSITTTNFVVKALMSIGQSKGGGIIIGAKVPIVLLSRSDSKKSKLHSMALGLNLLKGKT